MLVRRWEAVSGPARLACTKSPARRQEMDGSLRLSGHFRSERRGHQSSVASCTRIAGADPGACGDHLRSLSLTLSLSLSVSLSLSLSLTSLSLSLCSLCPSLSHTHTHTYTLFLISLLPLSVCLSVCLSLSLSFSLISVVPLTSLSLCHYISLSKKLLPPLPPDPGSSGGGCTA